MKNRESMRKICSEEKIARKAMKVAKKLKTDKFLWWKKIERDVCLGVALAEFSGKAEKKRQKDRMAEIEKLKKRREEREVAKARREEELMMLQRERVRAEADEFEKKEYEFLLDQCKLKSKIRFYEGRTKPIDILTLKYLDEFNLELDEPCMIFKGLTVREIEELKSDIELRLGCLYRSMPTDHHHHHHVKFWEALMVVCEWELGETRRKEDATSTGLHPSIETDVRNFLQGVKSYRELVALQALIESDMRSGKAKVVEYWEAVLGQIHVYKAKGYLKEIHAAKLDENLKFKEENIREEKVEEEGKDTRAFSLEAITPELEGSFSPQILHADHGTGFEEVINPDEDSVMLEKKLLAVLEEQQKRLNETMTSKPHLGLEDDFEVRAKKVMGVLEEGDVVFGSSAEVNLGSLSYWWHDKYRPRKPKYFIKVHTGYEWNMYNRTHYGRENPPPKFVQGYKFNIFYPHLVDKTKAPKCLIEKDGDSTDTCVLRFHAGPPYEDIAFQIANKEWEYSHNKGYKCTFEGGILCAYFNFKRDKAPRLPSVPSLQLPNLTTIFPYITFSPLTFIYMSKEQCFFPILFYFHHFRIQHSTHAVDITPPSHATFDPMSSIQTLRRNHHFHKIISNQCPCCLLSRVHEYPGNRLDFAFFLFPYWNPLSQRKKPCWCICVLVELVQVEDEVHWCKGYESHYKLIMAETSV